MTPRKLPQTSAGGTHAAADVLPAGLQAIAAAMAEDRGPDSLDAHVRKLIKDLGLLGYHTHDSRRSPGGFPDWVIVGEGVMFRELKKQNGIVTLAQRQWIDTLDMSGADADVWRPSDLLSGRIARELAAISYLAGATA